MLDPKRLEELGITRLGFTTTLADGKGAGTPLYLAPEVIAGQPFTVKSDIYALGVLLYQLVTGDLRNALAPGWEADVADELLREDIGLAAAGNPARRLTDAGQLAERLRTLERRRELRAAELAAEQRAERVRRIQQELRRTRVYALVLLGLAGVAIAGTVAAYRARNEAVLATANATAISQFLLEGVLWADNSIDSPRTDIYKASLDRAAALVDERFESNLEAAAAIHWLLGRRYEEVELIESAAAQYAAASAIYSRLIGPKAHETLLARERIASILVDHDGRDRAAGLIRELRAHWKSASQKEIVTLVWRTRIAKLLLLAGDPTEAERDLTEVLKHAAGANTLDETAIQLFKQWFGSAPRDLEGARTTLSAHANDLLSVEFGEFGDRYEEAEGLARRALALFVRLAGEDSEPAATARLRLGSVLMYRGKYDDAEPALLRARTFFDGSLPETHAVRGIADFWIGRVRLGQRRPAEALDLFRESYRRCGDKCPARRKYACLTGMGDAYADLAQWDAAIKHYEMALHVRTSIKGPSNILQYSAHIGLATSLWRKGRLGEALEVLRAIDERVIDEYPRHTFRASYLRIQGLLANAAKEHASAVNALRESVKIQKEVLGAAHWRVRQTESELSEILVKRPM
jgi:eukaryotic-like serine/threonine-protein kinase